MLTMEIRGNSQVKKVSSARRTLASCDICIRWMLNKSVELRTSLAINRTQVPISVANDDSIKSGWASSNSRRPSNASENSQRRIRRGM